VAHFLFSLITLFSLIKEVRAFVLPGVLDQSLNVILDGAPGKVQTHPIESGDDVFHFYS